MPSNEISERELRAYRAELRVGIFRQVHARLNTMKAQGLTQEEVAARIGMQPSQLSRLLKGENDLQLETLSDLARALDCRIVATVVPLEPKPRSESVYVFRISTGAVQGGGVTPTGALERNVVKTAELNVKE